MRLQLHGTWKATLGSPSWRSRPGKSAQSNHQMQYTTDKNSSLRLQVQEVRLRCRGLRGSDCPGLRTFLDLSRLRPGLLFLLILARQRVQLLQLLFGEHEPHALGDSGRCTGFHGRTRWSRCLMQCSDPRKTRSFHGLQSKPSWCEALSRLSTPFRKDLLANRVLRILPCE